MDEHTHDHKTSDKTLKEGIDRKKDGTIELTIVIPWKIAKEAQDDIEEELIKSIELKGFRKGQAPKHLARERLNPELVREELLKRVVTKAYNDAIKKHDITPIISPQVHIETFADGTDIIFTAETCEEPTVDLKNYKEEVKGINAKSKIVVPGKEDSVTGEPGTKASIDEIMVQILKTAEVKAANVLIENEASRLLSQLLDELKKLGLTLDQYLESRKLDPEQLRNEYKKKAEQDLKIEFILRKIADEEKITVEKVDIENALKTIENPKEKEEVMKNPYLVASIIRQQKTINFLSQL